MLKIEDVEIVSNTLNFLSKNHTGATVLLVVLMFIFKNSKKCKEVAVEFPICHPRGQQNPGTLQLNLDPACYAGHGALLVHFF